MKHAKPLEIFLAALIILTVTFLLFISALQSAHADGVYTCVKPGSVNYKDCPDASIAITNAPKDTNLVAVIYGGTIGPSSFWYEAGMRWIAWSNTSPDTLIGICGGNETDLQKCAHGNGGASQIQARKAIAGLASWKKAKAACWPNPILGELRVSLYPIATAVWYCDTPTRIVMEYRTGNPSSPFSLSAKPTPAQLDALDAQYITRDSTAAEMAAVDALHVAGGITIKVAASATDRPIYAATATNTKGAATGKRALVGSNCGWKRLQDAAGKGTNYFAVEGGYTLCSMTGAISK